MVLLHHSTHFLSSSCVPHIYRHMQMHSESLLYIIFHMHLWSHCVWVKKGTVLERQANLLIFIVINMLFSSPPSVPLFLSTLSQLFEKQLFSLFIFEWNLCISPQTLSVYLSIYLSIYLSSMFVVLGLNSGPLSDLSLKPHPPVLWPLVYFSDKFSCFCLGSSYLHPQSSWDSRHAPLFICLWWTWLKKGFLSYL
jgi:hypothetical protein